MSATREVRNVEKVMAAIEREADMDGLSTASSYRLAELAGVSAPTAMAAVRRLAAEGRVTILGRVLNDGGPFEVQIEDGAA